MKALSFNGVSLTPVYRNSQIYLTSSELAQALGYADAKSITNLYNANADEFSADMTEVIESMTSKNLKRSLRIFSLRGCHLIAMLARTDVAKDFRKWVLDILDKEVGEPVVYVCKSTLTTPDDRRPLVNAVRMLQQHTQIGYEYAYKMVNQYMGTTHIGQIPLSELPKAVAYVHELMLKAKPMDDRVSISAQHLAWHMQFIYSWYKAIEEPFRALSPSLSGQIHDHIIYAANNANTIGKHLGYDGMNPERIKNKKWAVGFH